MSAAPDLTSQGVPSQAFYGMNTGRQLVKLGAGGALSGMPGGDPTDSARAIKPQPYATGFMRFLSPGNYGAASTLQRNALSPNWYTGYAAFNPIGYVKPQTFTQAVF